MIDIYKNDHFCYIGINKDKNTFLNEAFRSFKNYK